jgi:nonribosomal peptide synthetase DhbF
VRGRRDQGASAARRQLGPADPRRPVGNARVYVLDEHLAPVPPGVPGELYLAGPGVARGYLNRPGLTATRFVPDPFGPPGDRMYATGDVVRWVKSGDLAFLGRADSQVKVSGVRIEPGEIEAALGQLPGVRQVAVTAVTNPGGGKRLAAYVAADGIDAGQLRLQAAERLPDYLVPTALVMLDELPLTINGKTDRKALPEPDWSARVVGREPRTPRERRLTEIFAEVLGASRVSIDDSFFDLGGHSLLAARLISRVRRELDADLSIRTLFAAPTPAALAEQLDVTADSDGLDVLISLRASGERAPLFCVHPAAGVSWVYSGLLRYLEPDRPVYGLRYSTPASVSRCTARSAASCTTACGTAAVVTPVGRVRDEGGDFVIGTGETGPVTSKLRTALLDVQHGRSTDPANWLHRVC